MIGASLNTVLLVSGQPRDHTWYFWAYSYIEKFTCPRGQGSDCQDRQWPDNHHLNMSVLGTESTLAEVRDIFSQWRNSNHYEGARILCVPTYHARV